MPLTAVALGPGTWLGSYEIGPLIGQGGMGEVYRARDRKLGRDVAVKLLPAAFTTDPERVARFQREAQLLAAINHPHIAAIYGLEESDGTRALVLELVDGETLAQRIARGPLPLDEAVTIARQIGEALAAAHEQGIVHRDLKPANIKIRSNGDVKVLDFGLAKSLEPDGTAGATEPSAITSPALLTGVGMLLGTAAYMAPEQAKGRSADKRTDIWAFGCVLFEMLTGRRLFGGENVAETLGAVLHRDADLSRLPDSVPVAIRTLLRRCLEKDPRRRIADIAAAVFTLEELRTLDGPAASAFRLDATRPPRRRGLAGLTLIAAMAAAVTGIAVWLAMRPLSPRVARFTVATTGVSALVRNGIDRDLAISPDGSRIVYVASNGTELFVRPFDALDPTSLHRGEPRAPFISPDGQWVGFVDGQTALKKVPIRGGPAVTLATLDGPPRGAVWLPDDTIVFATTGAATGLQQVNAAGGPATILTRPDRARGEADHMWPEAMPDGKAIVFTIWPVSGGVDASQIALFDRQSQAQTVVLRGGSHAQYVASGHLLYSHGNTLRAVSFDARTREPAGESIEVADDVFTTNFGAADASVARDGTLVYVRGSGVRAAQRTLVWVDRQGGETVLAAPPRRYLQPRLSPKGDRVAVWTNEQESAIWLWDIARKGSTRLTFAPSQTSWPIWTVDGRRVMYASNQDAARELFLVAADGTGTVEQLTRTSSLQSATGVSPDGRSVIVTQTAPTTGEDIVQVDLGGDHTVVPLIQSANTERNGIVSPDGRWLAYEANDSGPLEIHVRPYPAVNTGHWQVSNGGGTRPLWSTTGRELFYIAPTGAIHGVEVDAGLAWLATPPVPVVPAGYVTTANIGRNYDISPDGQRFLVLKAAGEPEAPMQLVVVQHFTEELTRLTRPR